jgi:hypothetical protein
MIAKPAMSNARGECTDGRLKQACPSHISLLFFLDD